VPSLLALVDHLTEHERLAPHVAPPLEDDTGAPELDYQDVKGQTSKHSVQASGGVYVKWAKLDHRPPTHVRHCGSRAAWQWGT
jgi:hypothetical protein